METMILGLNFVLLNSQDLLKEYLKKLFVRTVTNQTPKIFLAGCIRVEQCGGHSELGTGGGN